MSVFSGLGEVMMSSEALKPSAVKSSFVSGVEGDSSEDERRERMGSSSVEADERTVWPSPALFARRN